MQYYDIYGLVEKGMMEFQKQNLLKGLKTCNFDFARIVCLENRQRYTLKLFLVVLDIF